MSDQCRNCNHWNRLDGCLNEPCSIRESWYPQEMLRQRDELQGILRERDEEIERLRSRLAEYEEEVDDPQEIIEMRHTIHLYDGTAIKLNEANKEIERLRAALKPIKEVWEQYKHADELLSDVEFLKEVTPPGKALYNLWQAVKKAMEGVK